MFKTKGERIFILLFCILVVLTFALSIYSGSEFGHAIVYSFWFIIFIAVLFGVIVLISFVFYYIRKLPEIIEERKIKAVTVNSIQIPQEHKNIAVKIEKVKLPKNRSHKLIRELFVILIATILIIGWYYASDYMFRDNILKSIDYYNYGWILIVLALLIRYTVFFVKSKTKTFSLRSKFILGGILSLMIITNPTLNDFKDSGHKGVRKWNFLIFSIYAQSGSTYIGVLKNIFEI